MPPGRNATAKAGPLDEFASARADLLRGQIAFALGLGSDAPPLLLNAAKRANVTIKLWHYIVAFLLAALFGAIAVYTAYRAQDVWSLGDNWLSALVAGVTGATTGSMLTAMGVLFPEPNGGNGGPQRGPHLGGGALVPGA